MHVCVYVCVCLSVCVYCVCVCVCVCVRVSALCVCVCDRLQLDPIVATSLIVTGALGPMGQGGSCPPNFHGLGQSLFFAP